MGLCPPELKVSLVTLSDSSFPKNGKALSAFTTSSTDSLSSSGGGVGESVSLESNEIGEGGGDKPREFGVPGPSLVTLDRVEGLDAGSVLFLVRFPRRSAGSPSDRVLAFFHGVVRQ